MQDGGQFQLNVAGNTGIGCALFLSGSGWYEAGGSATVGALRFAKGATWAGDIVLTNYARVGVTNVSGPATGYVTGDISGPYTMEVGGGNYGNGSGTLTLTPDTGNTLAGLTVSNGGGGPEVVVAGNSVAFPTSTPATLTLNGGILAVNGSSFPFADLSGTSGTIENESSGAAATVTLVNNVAAATYNGQLIDGGAAALTVVKSGSGALTLGGSNTYSGGTTVQQGVLQLGNASALGSGALAANGSTLDLAGNSILVPSFSGAAAGFVTNSSLGVSTTLSTPQTNSLGAIATAFSGTITDGLGKVALEVTGGTLTLSGTGAYTGGTYVENTGTLIVTSPNAIDVNGRGTNLFVGNELNLFGTVESASAGQVPASPPPTAAVPEPGTLALLAAGTLAAFTVWRRRRN